MDAIGLAQQLESSGRSIRLGTFEGDREVSFASVRDSVVVVGPTGSGKTTRTFIPSVAVHPGPVVVTSVRQNANDPGLRPVTIGARQKIAAQYGGDVVELAVDDRFGFEGTPVWWDFTEGCEDWNVALRRSKSLARAGIQSSLENHHNWRTWVGELLAPLLFNAALGGDRTDRDVAEIVSNGPGGDHAELRSDPSTVHGQLQELEDLASQGIISPNHASIKMLKKYCGLGGLHHETVESTFTLASSDILSCFAYDPVVADTYTLNLEAFLRGYGTLYITVGHGGAEDVRMIVASLVEAIEQIWVGIPHDERPPSVLLALDEVSTIAPVPSMPTAIATYGGNGIQLLLGFQHSSLATETWGKAGLTVINGANHLILFDGLDDTELLQQLERLAPIRTHQEQIVRIRKTPPSGLRFASAEQLMEERQVLEDARQSAKPLAQAFKVRLALQQIRRDRGLGIRGRYGDSPEAIAKELDEFTSVHFTESRHPELEAHKVFSTAKDSVFIRSGNQMRFAKLSRYYDDPSWCAILGYKSPL